MSMAQVIAQEHKHRGLKSATNILVETAYLFPLRAHKISYFFPEVLKYGKIAKKLQIIGLKS